MWFIFFYNKHTKQPGEPMLSQHTVEIAMIVRYKCLKCDVNTEMLSFDPFRDMITTWCEMCKAILQFRIPSLHNAK